MHETDSIRRQLAAERAHLREILLAVCQETAPVGFSRPVTAYIEWASGRLLNQLDAHRLALQAMPTIGAATRAQLTAVATAATDVGDAAAPRAVPIRVKPLLALLEAWSESLDAVAGTTLRVNHWRQAAQLSADTILEERQLYAAARVATGSP